MRSLLISLFFLLATAANAQWAATQEELDYSRNDFRTIQSHLVAFGYPVKVDGKFGSQTDAAIYRFLQDVKAAGLLPSDYILIPFMERLHRQGWRRSGASGSTQSSTGHPSFDCGKARMASEIAICRNAELAALDRQIAMHYQRVLAYVSRSGRILTQAEQRDWLAMRDSCGSNVSCLQNKMQQRANELSYQGL